MVLPVSATRSRTWARCVCSCNVSVMDEGLFLRNYFAPFPLTEVRGREKETELFCHLSYQWLELTGRFRLTIVSSFHLNIIILRAPQPNSGDILAHEFLEANSWADGPAEDGACTLSKSPPIHAMNGAYSDGLRSDGKKPGRLYMHYPKARSVIGMCEDGLTEFG